MYLDLSPWTRPTTKYWNSISKIYTWFCDSPFHFLIWEYGLDSQFWYDSIHLLHTWNVTQQQRKIKHFLKLPRGHYNWLPLNNTLEQISIIIFIFPFERKWVKPILLKCFPLMNAIMRYNLTYFIKNWIEGILVKGF